MYSFKFSIEQALVIVSIGSPDGRLVHLPPIKKKKCAFTGNSFKFTLGRCILTTDLCSTVRHVVARGLIPTESNETVTTTWRPTEARRLTIYVIQTNNIIELVRVLLFIVLSYPSTVSVLYRCIRVFGGVVLDETVCDA